MNENEKLANAEAENEKIISESAAQTTNDSQQNINSESEDSSKAAPKKTSRSRKKPSADAAEAEKSPAPDLEEKPKRKTTRKKAEAPADTPADAAATEKGAEKENPEAEPVAEKTVETAAEDSPVTEAAEAAVEEAVESTAEELPSEKSDSKKEADVNYSEPSLIISAEQFAWDLDDDDDDDSSEMKFIGERIIPPDELFANRSYPEKETEELPDTLLEDSEEISDEADEEYDEDENLDDDGQYTLSELELQNEMSEKAFTDEAMQKYDPKNPRKIDGRFDLVELFVFTLLAVMIVTTFFFRHAVVDGASMENTLHGGEHLIISDFFYTPERGDIIVCEDYTTELAKPIVKRVIAVGGDHIVIKENGAVYVNDVRQDEDYVFIDGLTPMYSVDKIVDEGELFVMGDHRNVSLDSRAVGTISVDSVLGKVLLRFYPFDKFGTVN